MEWLVIMTCEARKRIFKNSPSFQDSGDRRSLSSTKGLAFDCTNADGMQASGLWFK
jgi:hypothetical protein